jgi:hypothetical protein
MKNFIFKWIGLKKKYILAGVMRHTCNPGYLGGGGKRIESFEVS